MLQIGSCIVQLLRKSRKLIGLLVCRTTQFLMQLVSHRQELRRARQVAPKIAQCMKQRAFQNTKMNSHVRETVGTVY